jgi:hypothetical protein
MARIALARHAAEAFSRIGRLVVGFSNAEQRSTKVEGS